MSQKIPRKKFFRILGGILLIPFAAVWYSTTDRELIKINRKIKITVPLPVPKGITFYDSIIVSKNDNSTKVFSAKCTHLGCIINHVENDELVCPCHGSRFSETGKVIKGPAIKPLKQLQYKINDKKEELVVNVEA